MFLLQFPLTVPGRLAEVVAHRMALWSAAFPRLLLTDHTCAAHGNHLVEGQVLLEDMDCISQLYGAAAMLRAQPAATSGGHGSPQGATGRVFALTPRVGGCRRPFEREV
jgi:hypothetical protein